MKRRATSWRIVLLLMCAIAVARSHFPVLTAALAAGCPP